MIQSIIHQLLRRRHFWRHATFSEIAELYTARLLRMTAINLVGALMSVYMYQIGYSVPFIVGFWGVYYLFMGLMALPMAALSAWFGPKHGILLSNILYIPSMFIFLTVPEHGLVALIIVGVLQGMSSTLYAIAYTVDFSKVKSVEHAGKEIAFMNIVEKVTAGLSPLIGGVLAFFLGPSAVLAVAGVLFLLAAWPLFKTAEPVSPRQKLNFRGFPWRLLGNTAVAQAAYGFDVYATRTWALYTAVFIIGVSATSDDVYLVNGLIMSVVLLVAIASSYAYGRLIDRRRGKELMQAAVIANAMTHVVRPFIATPVSAAGVNVANEVATAGYLMPFTRAVYDNADLSGQRTLYAGLNDLLVCLGAGIAGLLGAGLAMWLGDRQGLDVLFYVAAGVVLLILTARFPMFKR